jgi:hypothetical protein
MTTITSAARRLIHRIGRIRSSRDVLALPPGEPASTILHVGYRLVQHRGDRGRVGGIVATGDSQGVQVHVRITQRRPL